MKDALQKAYADHSRMWKKNKWIYPVISRRAGGISIGINLNPNMECSFRCAYCQVDRTQQKAPISLDLQELKEEIVALVSEYEKNGLSNFANFKDIPQEKRMLKDLCLSGDGESTMVKEFEFVCELMSELQEFYNQYPLQLTLITNGVHLHLERVQRGLSHLTKRKGEIWAKLDAGSEEWFKIINGSAVSLEKIQENLEMTVKKFPMQIQTMLCSIDGKYPSEKEQELYIGRLKRIYEAGKENFKGVQLYGVVRQTALDSVEPLPREFLESVALKIKKELQVPVNVF